MKVEAVPHKDQTWVGNQEQDQKDWDAEVQNRKRIEDTPPPPPPPPPPADPQLQFQNAVWTPTPGGAVQLPGQEPVQPPTEPKIWGNLEQDPAKRNDLNKPLNTSEEIYNHWDQWGFNQGIPFTNPAPANADPNAKAFIEFAAQNPSLVRAWDTNGDGTITRDEVGQFITGTKKDIQDAEKAYSDYLTKNPNADDASKKVARDAALIAANRYLVGHGDTYIHAGHLNEFAGANNPGFSKDLIDAAWLFSDPGMAAQLDMGGDVAALNKADGLFGVQNIVGWLNKGAPRNANEFAAMLQDAAFRDISGADTSGIGKDIFDNPGKYTVEQRAAAMRELMLLRERVVSAIENGLWDQAGSVWLATEGGVNPNKDKVLSDINAKIAKLSADPELKQYLQANLPTALQKIVNADPQLKALVEQELNSFKGGGGGAANPFNITKDENGKDIPISGRLASLSTTLETFHAALGLQRPNPAEYVSPEMRTEIQNYYESNILTGKDLQDMLAKNVPLQDAINLFGGQVAIFNSFLDPQYVQNNSTKLSDAFAKVLTDYLGNTDLKDLEKIFGDANGNLDEAKLTAILEEMKAADPAMFTTPTGEEITVQQVVTALRGSWDGLVRQPGKVADALTKINANFKLPDSLSGLVASNSYKAGILHIISSVFLGGAAAARGVGFRDGVTPQEIIGFTAAAAGTIGLATEGITKQSLMPNWHPGGTPPTGFPERMKIWENRGKALGGVAGIIGSVANFIGFANALQKGDIAGATLNFVNGAAGAASGIASTAEAFANLFGNFTKVTLGRFAAFAGAFGWAAAGISLLTTIVPAIIERVRQENDWRAAGANIKELASKYGIAPLEQAVESDWPQIPDTPTS